MKLLFDQNLSFKLAKKLDDVFAGSSQLLRRVAFVPPPVQLTLNLP